MFPFIVNGNRGTHVMFLVMGSQNARKHGWEKEKLGQKNDLYYMKELEDYNSPRLGQTKNEVGISRDSAKTSRDNLPKR